MTKADLKAGYLVKCRSAEIKMVMMSTKGLTFVNRNGEHFNEHSLKNDLTTTFNSDFDIIEVYGFSRFEYKALDFNTQDRELLWKREEVKELTVDEISKLLGYQVKVVGNN